MVNYWETMKSFQFNEVENVQLDAEQEKFTNAVKVLAEGARDGDDEALQLLEELFKNTKNEEIKKNSAIILFQQLFWNDQWEEINRLKLYSCEAVDASYRKFAEVLSESKDREYNFHAKSFKGKLSFSLTGSPIVDIEINGKQKKFWLDTGALLSIVSKETAAICGVTTDEKDKISVETSTDKQLDTAFGVVENIHIGNFNINNNPVLILPTENLILTHPITKETIKIDGIIGWDIIRYINLKLDYRNSEYEIEEPSIESTKLKNMLMDSYVVVRIANVNQTPLYFGLDTGAGRTSLGNSIFKKIEFEEIRTELENVGGVGGFLEVEHKVVPELKLKIGTTDVELTNVAASSHSPCSFFEVDGILGSDAIKNGSIRLDYQNRIFEFKNS